MRPATRILPFLCAALLLGSCMSPTDPDTPRIRITDPTRYFLRTYDFGPVDHGYDIVQLEDGGFIVVGAAYVKDKASQDVILLRLDAEGNQLWVKNYGGVWKDIGHSVSPTQDGGYIITGETESYTNGRTDLWLIKTDGEGAMQWSKHFGYKDYDSGEQVLELRAGGYMVVGYCDVPTSAGSSLWVIRTDELGNLIWEKTLGDSERDLGSSIVETADGDIIVAGSTELQGNGSSALWLLKMAVAGGDSLIWERVLDGTNSKSCSEMLQGEDGSIALIGHMFDIVTRKSNMLFVKSDETGDMITERKLHEDAIASSFEQTADGGYIVCGYNDPWPEDITSVILLKLDANGNTLWKNVINISLHDRAQAVINTSDGGYILAGSTFSPGDAEHDLLIIKTDQSGSYEE